MLNLRNKSVNVSRLVLIDNLKSNLETHKEQFKEAVVVYQTRLQLELQEALDIVTDKGISFDALKNVRVTFTPPQNHEHEYQEVLEMMEMSVDDTINLDSDRFRAYIKNEWTWSAPLSASIAANKMYIDSKMF